MVTDDLVIEKILIALRARNCSKIELVEITNISRRYIDDYLKLAIDKGLIVEIKFCGRGKRNIYEVVRQND
jgi:predicted HTH transcriptional regulator